MTRPDSPIVTISGDVSSPTEGSATYAIGALRGGPVRRVFVYGPGEGMPPMFEMIGVVRGRTPGDAIATWLQDRFREAREIHASIFWHPKNVQLRRFVYDVHIQIAGEERDATI